MRCFYILMANLKKKKISDNTKCRWECWATRTFIHCWKTVWQFPIKLNNCSPYEPAILLLGISPQEIKTYASQKPICKFHISFIYNCQNVDTILQLVSKHRAVGPYSGTPLHTKKELSKCITWANLKHIMLSQRS